MKSTHSCFVLGLLFNLTPFALSQSTAGACEGNIETRVANNTRRTLTSPNYPANYHNNQLCRWVLRTALTYEVVRFRMLDYNLEKMANCAADYVEVKNGGNSFSPQMRKYCGSQDTPGLTYISTESAIMVILKTDRRNVARGFKLEYWTEPKGDTVFKKAELTMAHLALFGVFGSIVCAIGLTVLMIRIIRTNPRLYARFIMKQPKRPVITPNDSLVSINAALSIQKRKASSAAANFHNKHNHRLNASVTTLTTPV